MPPAPQPIGHPVAAIGFVLLSQWCLSTLDATGKWVMAGGVTLFILCWFRYTVHLVLVLALLAPSRGLGMLRTRHLGAQLARGAVMLLATVSFFNTLKRLPVAEATAINFLAPLIVLAISPWLLKEPRYLSRWVAAGVAFTGMLIVVRPGGGLDPLGTLFGLMTAVCFAGQYIATRRVAGDDPFTTLVWSGLVGTVALTVLLPFTLPPALPALQALDPWQWVLLVSTGVSGALGHLFQIQAFRLAPASLLSPFMYVQIAAATTMGWLIFGHFPDRVTWLGIGVICLSGATIAIIEWRRR